MRDFKKLEIWTLAHELTLDIYKASTTFPKEELFGLTSQIRRSVASVPTNIAEGCGRNSKADTAHFIQIAIGSLCETEYHIILAHDLKYMSEPNYTKIIDKLNTLRRMMISFNNLLRND